MYKFILFFYLPVVVRLLEASTIIRPNSVSISKLATCQEFITSSENCEHFIPVKRIKNYANETYNLYYKFHVFSYTDANFYLTNNQTAMDCRIVVGAWGNTRSFIDCHGNQLDNSTLRGINSPMFPITIVVRLQRSGLLEVLLPGIVEPLLAGDLSTVNITNFNNGYVCFYAYRQPNRWFYNCCEEEDKYYDHETKECVDDRIVSFDRRFG